MIVGTHNLQRGDAKRTRFADVTLWTEAPSLTPRRGLTLLVCQGQRDLAVEYKPSVLTVHDTDYRRAHDGQAGFTPHRGTYCVKGRLVDGRKVAILVEHRINGAFDPGQTRPAERRALWDRHTALTLGWATELMRAGYEVIGGGDLNTWAGHSGYYGVLREVGGGLDRLGVSRGLGQYIDVRHLSRRGSNHKRLRATLRQTKP